MSVVNLRPSSTALASGVSTTEGVVVPKIVQGHWPLTLTPADGASVLSLSSVARLLIETVSPVLTFHPYDHVVVDDAFAIVAGCQVAPPSVETSTPATTPPPASVAVPVTVTCEPFARFVPG